MRWKLSFRTSASNLRSPLKVSVLFSTVTDTFSRFTSGSSAFSTSAFFSFSKMSTAGTQLLMLPSSRRPYTSPNRWFIRSCSTARSRNGSNRTIAIALFSFVTNSHSLSCFCVLGVDDFAVLDGVARLLRVLVRLTGLVERLGHRVRGLLETLGRRLQLVLVVAAHGFLRRVERRLHRGAHSGQPILVLGVGLLHRVDQRVGPVPQLDRFASSRVIRGVRLRFLHHAIHLALAEATRTADGDGLLLAGGLVLGRHVHDAVGVDVEGHFDVRQPARRRREPRQMEPPQRPVVARQ